MVARQVRVFGRSLFQDKHQTSAVATMTGPGPIQVGLLCAVNADRSRVSNTYR